SIRDPFSAASGMARVPSTSLDLGIKSDGIPRRAHAAPPLLHVHRSLDRGPPGPAHVRGALRTKPSPAHPRRSRPRETPRFAVPLVRYPQQPIRGAPLAVG